MADMVTIMNTILANGSAEYAARVPAATRTNIADIANPILTYTTVQNEFLTNLINKIGLTVIQNKTLKNPLAVLKKGDMPLGQDVEEIFINLAKDTGYDATGSKLLTKTTPDVKVAYHRLNREGQYPTTIGRQQLTRAFTSWADLESMLNACVTALYSGDNKDEYVLMKNLISDAITKDETYKVEVAPVTDEASAKLLVKAIKTISGLLTFPRSEFNAWVKANPSDAAKPVTTWTPKEDQILLIRSDIMAEIDVDVLAAAFNLDKVSFAGMVMEVDDFGQADKTLAVLADRSWTQVRDNLYEVTNFYNGQGLYTNFWLNHWQSYSYSNFANAVSFNIPAV
jgi:hypothetical protein